MEAAKKLHSIYIPGYAFPEWVLEPELWTNGTHDFESVKVFYQDIHEQALVRDLMTQREPCNIGMRRIYLKEKLYEAFGYEVGAYAKSTSEKLMPNLAVYTHATVKLQSGFKKVHVINLIGTALDSLEQPDYKYFKERSKSEIIQHYKKMWCLALAAMIQSPCKKLQVYNVGGGAFAGTFFQDFTREIFEPAIKSLLPLFSLHGFEIIGYDWNTHWFTGGFIPNCLETENLETTMFVNAWDPWSILGNGNGRDRSLDGYWGRSTNISVLGWLHTNPDMIFCPVTIEL